MSEVTPVRVVVVDDHAVVLEGLRGLLARSGFEVLATTGDRDEAVRLVALHAPDLAVVDVRLGGASGVDLVPDLVVAHPGLRICMLTSFKDSAAARQALEHGATGFVLKDQPADELCRQLADVARGALYIDHRVASHALKPSPSSGLSAQELAVLELAATGANNREIGRQLHLSSHTVKEYLGNVMRKLDVHTRTEAVAVALRRGLLRDRPPT